MSLLPFCAWLASTHGSIALKESLKMWTLVEALHVWTLTLFLGVAFVLDLRLLGFTMRAVPVSQVIKRLEPWALAGFILMVTTGLLLFYATPVKTYQNIFFRVKIIMLVMAGLNVWLFHTGIYRTIAEWDVAALIPQRARMAGAISLVLWIAIIIAGRLTAYYWFDCETSEENARIINVLQGCQTP